MKANWACKTCGMYSSRRYSVQRHINTIHSGDGTPIPFVEYLVGRTSGKYPPGPARAFGATDTSQLDKMRKELERIRNQRVIELCLPPAGDPSYAAQANVLRTYVSTRANSEYLKLFHELMTDLINPA